MTEYSFRTEIVWPKDMPELSPEDVAKISARLEADFVRIVCPPQPAPIEQIKVERCCYGIVLHAPNCKFWCGVT